MFWSLTLRVIGVILDASVSRMHKEHNDRAWLAWHIEALARQKKLPKLKSLLIDAAAAKPKRRQTVEEQIAIAHRWTAALTRK